MHWRFAQIAMVLFIVAGTMLLFGKNAWFPEFYSTRYMGVMALVNAAIIAGLPRVFRAESQTQKTSLEKMRTMVVVSLVLNALGALGLYKLYLVGFPYDKFLHFLIPLLLTLSLVYFRTGWKNASIPSAMSWSLLVVFSSGIGWEVWEAFSDWIFRTQSWGVYREHIVEDTAFDILMNTLGILTAAGIARLGLVSFSANDEKRSSANDLK